MLKALVRSTSPLFVHDYFHKIIFRIQKNGNHLVPGFYYLVKKFELPSQALGASGESQKAA